MRRALAILCSTAMLAACSHNEPLALHGAASMRVEVEVYKGPLTSPVHGQVGDLIGALGDAVHATFEWRQKALTVCGETAATRPTERVVRTSEKVSKTEKLKQSEEAQTIEKSETIEKSAKFQTEKRPTPSGDDACFKLESAIKTAEDILGAACQIVDGPSVETLGRTVYVPKGTCAYIKRRDEPRTPGLTEGLANAAITALVQKCVDTPPPGERPLLWAYRCHADVLGLSLDNLAAILSGAADRAAADAMAIPVNGTQSRTRQGRSGAEIRALLVEYATMTAEYGSRIHARTTTLAKQLATEDPRDPKTLPVSDYLRSTSRTDYIQLYDWLMKDNTPGVLPATERIAVAQRLTADSYWQKVNEVYASGQGDVAMAFIKDDLGNWDLKSFSNDPSDLLRSYRRVTDAALKTAASLATRAATGPAGQITERLTAAQKATSLANQLATGTVPATPGVIDGIDISALHVRTAERMAAQKTRFETLQARLTKEAEARKGDAEKAAKAKEENDGKLTDARNELKSAIGSRDDANTTLQTKLTELNAEQAKEGADTKDEEAAVKAAKDSLKLAQDRVDIAQTEVLKLEAAVAAQEKAQTEAKAKADAADERLKDLPKEAIEAVRGTLDDHLAVVSALQDGIASSSPGAGARPPATAPTP